MAEYNLFKNAMDQILHPSTNAKRIVVLAKECGRITGYKLSAETFVSAAVRIW